MHLDVSVPLVPGRVPLYPGDTELEVDLVQARRDGEPANVSRLVCSLHAGTHVDGPSHFFAGEPGVESVDLDALIGPVQVVDARSVRGVLDVKALEELAIPDGCTRVLFLTTNSALWDEPRFVEDFVALSAGAAQALVDQGIRLVGVDGLSVAPYRDPAPTHEVLLRAGIAIVETLDLRGVEPGPWELICLPLRIPGADGAPARVLLSRD